MKYFVAIFLTVCSLLANVKAEQKLMGGAKAIDINDPTANNLLDENLAELDSEDGGHFSLINKEKITRQVVAGVMYKFYGDFQVGHHEEPEECIISMLLHPYNHQVKIKADCGEKTYHSKNFSSYW